MKYLGWYRLPPAPEGMEWDAVSLYLATGPAETLLDRESGTVLVYDMEDDPEPREG